MSKNLWKMFFVALRNKCISWLTGLATALQIKTANTAADPMKTDREIILIKIQINWLMEGTRFVCDVATPEVN